MKKILALFFTLSLLVACASSDAPPAPQDMSFKDQKPIALAVSDFQIIQDYKSPMASPNVEHLFPITPSKAVENWVKDRLTATGGQFLARVVVRDASVKETELPYTKGWRGWFSTEEAARFDGSLSVMIEIVRPDGYVEAYVSAKSTQSRTVLENASASDKDRAWYDLTRALANDIDRELTKQIGANFGPILMNRGPAVM